ncbi:hypothetical protein JST56_03310 [Candidatus Dependentiae bacterium]|nr:hypothetical protein [Candidatus Dependentiae bacterium]
MKKLSLIALFLFVGRCCLAMNGQEEFLTIVVSKETINQNIQKIEYARNLFEAIQGSPSKRPSKSSKFDSHLKNVELGNSILVLVMQWMGDHAQLCALSFFAFDNTSKLFDMDGSFGYDQECDQDVIVNAFRAAFDRLKNTGNGVYGRFFVDEISSPYEWLIPRLGFNFDDELNKTLNDVSLHVTCVCSLRSVRWSSSN